MRSPDSHRATVERSTKSFVASCCCEKPRAALSDLSESANVAPMGILPRVVHGLSCQL